MDTLLKIMSFLLQLVVHSPFYPHWLVALKHHEAERLILRGLSGRVLEVGAGDGAKKNELCERNPQIKKYVATDYSSWDEEFSNIDSRVSMFGQLAEIFYGFSKRQPLDVICDAMKLPFKDNSFDYHLSFEVLEHIENPNTFLKEASRVLKKNGKVILSVPFMFRIHGGEPDHQWDYYRYAPGFFYAVAKQNKLRVMKIYSNTGVGTTVANTVNQWLILKIRESQLLKYPLFMMCPFIFCFTNLLGYILDLKPDFRFSTRLYVILQK